MITLSIFALYNMVEVKEMNRGEAFSAWEGYFTLGASFGVTFAMIFPNGLGVVANVPLVGPGVWVLLHEGVRDYPAPVFPRIVPV